MHDIRILRDDPEAFDAALARRGIAPRAVDLLAIDARRRAAIAAAETAQAERNAASKLVGAAKARGDEAEFERLRALVAARRDEGARLEAEAQAADAALTAELMALPNAPLAEVPDGADESGNVELRRWGAPRAFDFDPREHFEIAEAMGGMDFDAAARLSGARFVVLRGAVARLHRALGQFMIDMHVEENGLTEVWTPVLVRDEAMLGAGQLPKFADEAFFGASMRKRSEMVAEILGAGLSDAETAAVLNGDKTLLDAVNAAFDSAPTREDFWLIPTSEVTLTNLVAGQILDAAALPQRYTALTQCFRAEAGSAGKDTRGMLRQHQFEKVEMVSITRPEDSRAELDRMTACAEGVLQRLGLPYRTMLLCAGDMGFGGQRTHDIEVWLPGQNTYREISSCSVCGDFQARRMNARFRREDGAKPEFVHTLNGSGLAVGRCLIAVIENGQQADGSVTIPEALRAYMKGASMIAPDGSLG